MEQKKAQIKVVVRWVIGGLFALFAIVNGFHFSSIFIALASFLILPLPFMEAFYKQKNIKGIVVIILSVTLLFAGALTSPTENTSSSMQSEKIEESQRVSESKKIESESKKKESQSKKTESESKKKESESNVSQEKESVVSSEKNSGVESSTKTEQMVWVSSTGKKYHSISNCSNMKSPSQISLEEAEEKGYTPCSRCC